MQGVEVLRERLGRTSARLAISLYCVLTVKLHLHALPKRVLTRGSPFEQNEKVSGSEACSKPQLGSVKVVCLRYSVAASTTYNKTSVDQHTLRHDQREQSSLDGEKNSAIHAIVPFLTSNYIVTLQNKALCLGHFSLLVTNQLHTVVS